MRVRVLLRGHAVGGPAGVGNAEFARDMLRLRKLFQFRHAAGGTHALQLAVVLAIDNSDAR